MIEVEFDNYSKIVDVFKWVFEEEVVMVKTVVEDVDMEVVRRKMWCS